MVKGFGIQEITVVTLVSWCFLQVTQNSDVSVNVLLSVKFWSGPNQCLKRNNRPNNLYKIEHFNNLMMKLNSCK